MVVGNKRRVGSFAEIAARDRNRAVIRVNFSAEIAADHRKCAAHIHIHAAAIIRSRVARYRAAAQSKSAAADHIHAAAVVGIIFRYRAARHHKGRLDIHAAAAVTRRITRYRAAVNL